jgi:tRNA(Ile)-lysidine synthase
MDAEARRHCPRGALETSALAALPPALRRRVCRLWLAAHGVPVERIGFDAVERVERLANQPRGSRSIELAGGWTVRRRYGALAVEQRTTRSPYRTALRIPGDTPLPEPGLRVTVTVAAGIAKPKARCGELPARGSLSRRAVGRRTLYVRSWRPGDRMKPLGMSGSRKLQDIFTDAKIPSDRRSAIPVFECAGEIVWIPGYRVARGWEVPDDSQPAIQVGVESMDEVSPRQEGHRA